MPRTIESTREKDETVLDPQIEANEERIEEMNLDIQNDEFQEYFQQRYEPKVLITYADNPLKVRYLCWYVFGIMNCMLLNHIYNELYLFSGINKISVCLVCL